MVRPQTCPICKRPIPLDPGSRLPTFPFCSERCRQVDFFRWSEGRYAIVEPIDPDDPRLSDDRPQTDDE